MTARVINLLGVGLVIERKKIMQNVDDIHKGYPAAQTTLIRISYHCLIVNKTLIFTFKVGNHKIPIVYMANPFNVNNDMQVPYPGRILTIELGLYYFNQSKVLSSVLMSCSRKTTHEVICAWPLSSAAKTPYRRRLRFAITSVMSQAIT